MTGSAGDTAVEDKTAETADFADRNQACDWWESGPPNIEFFKNKCVEFESATGISS